MSRDIDLAMLGVARAESGGSWNPTRVFTELGVLEKNGSLNISVTLTYLLQCYYFEEEEEEMRN